MVRLREGSNEAFGYTVATCDPRPEQIQEGLVMEDVLVCPSAVGQDGGV